VRRPLVAGNWKMHKTGPDATAYCARLRELLAAGTAGDVAVCPPFTAIADAAAALRGSSIRVGAQNVHHADQGPYTGEVSAPMLLAAGADLVIVGHSERRAMGERDADVALKLGAALAHGLFVVLCVGESLEQREAGLTEGWVADQVRAATAGLDRGTSGRLAIAYEPIWAIGTGRTATPEIAQEACAHVRAVAGEALDGGALRVLYGGSVTPENARGLLSLPHVDGALVGGASLDPDGFARIVAAAG
jgi:triosephosphate isomerase